MSDWDQRIWRMATSPWVIGGAALLVVRRLAIQLQTGAPIEDVIVGQWFIPLLCTITIAGAVAYWGIQRFWSLTRIVMVGVAFAMLAQPFVRYYVTALNGA